MSRVVNFQDPASSAAAAGNDGEFVIAFPLVRVRTGDYIEFSKVKFFQNSAILQPDSKPELDGLVKLMQENEKYKIKIHGHCNGDKPRDIVSKGKSTNFFATDAANVKERATPKKLSELRAEIVKEYLVAQGIDEGRIKTRGAGSKEYIYPPGSTLATRNDRVEVQIRRGR